MLIFQQAKAMNWNNRMIAWFPYLHRPSFSVNMTIRMHGLVFVQTQTFVETEGTRQ